MGLTEMLRRGGPAVLDAARTLAVGLDHRPAVDVRLRGVRLRAAVVLVLVAVLVDVAQLGGGVSRSVIIMVLLAVGHSGAVLMALRRPLAGWRLSFVTTALTPLVVEPSGLPWPESTVLLHLITVGLLALAASGRVVVLAVIVDVAAAAITAPFTVLDAGFVVQVLLGVVAAVGTVAGLGAALGAQRHTAGRLAEARRGSAEEQAQRAVLEERARIAREMHDVVAHQLSAIAVRAESAPQRLRGTPGPAAAELRTIAAAARDALTDMRRLLGVLRADEPDRPGAPAPDLDGIGELVASLRGSSTEVHLDVLGEPRPVPGPVGLVGYRVVQEALRNAATHATGAAVIVRMEWLPAALRLRVDNGSGAVAPSDGAGQGLLGMRERVDAVGGLLVAGPRSDGGFTVDVTVPLDGPPR